MRRNPIMQPNLLTALACVVLLTPLAGGGCGGKDSNGGVCGNGVIEGTEECDDRNLVSGDGCSIACELETTTECGNSIIETGEECDDGNTDNGDGCSAVCSLEVAPGCGNGVVEVSEGCDDGNITACDGCSAACDVEACGNTVTECDEQCDDGNTTAGDGCDAACLLEAGGCGDGTLDTGEECDDGNTTNGDGCDSDCNLEVAPGCGNGVVEVGEDCDDGNMDDNDACVTGCVTAACGDGFVRTGVEECDDGNTTAGDGCDAACDLEVAPGCGNGVLESGEDCDDGNNTDCDGCSATCTDELCGNGTVECAEQCDDGNTTSGDGCDAGCNSEVAPGCGNGVLESGEGCDDNNTTACDGCSATCAVEACGNSTTECSEQCDDGNTTPGDGCDANCQNEVTPVCGNGTQEAGEACDDGNNSNADGCLNTCVIATCGDNFIWTGTETCDDGNTTAGDGCDANCLLEGCGNGTQETGEQCDDNNTTPCDGCSASCQVESCGNGTQECAEECDDGNNTSGDGCDATCHSEGPQCTAEWPMACGEEDPWNNSFAGSTDVVDSYSCSTFDESGPEYTYSFLATANETVTVGISGMSADLDIFVIDDQGGVCDPTSCQDWGESSVTFAAVSGTTYYFVVDGYQGAVSDYNLSVVCPSAPSCGDGTVDSSEECDDGNFDDTDACVSSCVTASCGDGFVHASVEECDDGNSNNNDACRNDCSLPVCGDGILDAGEQCDDGNTNDGDGCDATCAPEYCNDDWTLLCGDSDSYNNGLGGSLDIIDTYSCTAWDESGPEFAYLYTAITSGQVTVDLTVTTAGQDLDVFVIPQSNGLCSPTDCLSYGGDGAVFNAVAGQSYYIVVDGYQGAVGDYTLDLTCASCGNGILEFDEQCDDNNNTNGDGCDANCVWESTECAPAFPLDCGDTDSWHNRGGGHTDNNDAYGCNTWDETGPEFTYVFNPANSGDVTVDLTNMTGDLDVYVLSSVGMVCDPTNCLAFDDDSVTFAATGGEIYFIVVDGYQGAESPYTIDVSCTNP